MFHEHLFLKSFGVWKFHRISTRESRFLHLEQTCSKRSFAVLNSSIGGTEHLKHNALGVATKCWLCIYLYPHNGNVCFPRRSTSKLCTIPGLLHRWGKITALLPWTLLCVPRASSSPGRPLILFTLQRPTPGSTFHSQHVSHELTWDNRPDQLISLQARAPLPWRLLHLPHGDLQVPQSINNINRGRF